MRRGETVFQAMCAARIFRDVSADRTNRLRRRIRRVEIILVSDTGSDVQIDDAGFDGNPRIWQIDFQNAIHARQADDDPVLDRQSPAAQAGS